MALQHWEVRVQTTKLVYAKREEGVRCEPVDGRWRGKTSPEQSPQSEAVVKMLDY